MNYKVEAGVENFAWLIVILNHVNNPVIYGIMNGNFRQAVLKLFRRNKA